MDTRLNSMDMRLNSMDTRLNSMDASLTSMRDAVLKLEERSEPSRSTAASTSAALTSPPAAGTAGVPSQS